MILLNLVRTTPKLKPITSNFCRCYATIIEKELEIPTFCDLHIQIPYNIYVKPLNIHKYHNCDKLILKIDETVENTLKYDVNGNQILIQDDSQMSDIYKNILLTIKAPVKANLYVNSEKNIKIGYFHGDKLYLKSKNGNINIDKYQGDIVKLIAHRGNINIEEFLQASDVDAAVLDKGNINAVRLQSINLRLQTKQGNITVESSYAHESYFNTSKGNIDLHNTHKACKVFLEDGTLNLTGFDGQLKTVVDNGSANIQLARITDTSEINIMNGSLNLKLAETCQNQTGFKIKTLDWEVPESLKMIVRNSEGVVNLVPEFQEENIVKVNCMKGSVVVDSASWQDMMKLRMKNNNSQ